MKLKALFPKHRKIPNLEIKGINCNSNLISENELFVAIRGTECDGHKFIAEAIGKGAVAVVKQKNTPIAKNIDLDKIVTIDVVDTRKALSDLAAKFYNFPSGRLKVIGITGTNGKTTVAYLIESILKEAGYFSGVIGTISYKFKNLVLPSVNTTPGPLEIQSFLAKMVKEKLDFCIMEVSSHSLAQDRVRDVYFHIAVFTNLTREHLDYHCNFGEYFRAKAKLFESLSPESWAVINNDEPYSLKLLKFIKSKKVRFGFSGSSEIRARDIRSNIKGSVFLVDTPKGSLKIKTNLIGRYNIYNILAAIAVAFVENIDFDIIEKGIQKINYIPGRLESINKGQRFSLFVDYAHTDDALRNVLSSLKEFNKGRIIVVFGCGGQRDISKRAKMGRIASNLADYCILTNDNPRNENPLKIINDILKGIKTNNFDVILDRQKAIEKAIELAKNKDTVLIAGKGHETSQLLKNKILPFDDREVVRKILRCLK
jgi:UDP-N-acetylmuramoyl-L-alanyl-D-glutamate--2,6-diaminopimelate ligase